MIGKERLTEKEKEVLRGLVNHTCEECLLHEYSVGKLEPHRMTPKNKGGKYCPRNIKMCCYGCHKKFTKADREAR